MHQTRTRRTALIALLTGAATLLSWAFGVPSGAESGAVVPAGWAWIAERSTAALPSSGSGVPSADVSVAWAAGQPTKIAYVAPPTPTNGAHVRLRLLVDPHYTTAVGADTAALQACLVLTPWTAAGPMAWDSKPVTDCRVHAVGSWVAARNEYTFDVTALAALLEPGRAAYGVSVEPAGSPTTPFDAAFLPPAYDVGGATEVPVGVSGAGAQSVAPVSSAVLALPRGVPVLAADPEVPVAGPPAVAGPPTAPAAAAASTARSAPTVNMTGVYALVALFGVLPALAVAWRPSPRRVTP
jgi:hypothetical protein